MKRYMMLSLVLLWSLGGASIWGWAQEEETAFDRGTRAFNIGEYATAKAALEQAYKEDAQDSAVILMLTETYIRLRDYRRAEEVIEAGAKLYPEAGTVRFKQGIVQNLRGRFDRAQEAFNMANECLPADSPERTSLYINMGVAIMNAGRPLDAIPWFDQAIDLSPRNITAYTSKGASLYKVGDYLEAASIYDRAIELDQTNPLSYYNRGMAYLRGGDATKGCADFHTACRMGNMNACKAIVVECKKQAE